MNACEHHPLPGACAPECAVFTNSLNPYEGIDWYDPTGCSYPEPKPREVAVFNPVTRGVEFRTEMR